MVIIHIISHTSIARKYLQLQTYLQYLQPTALGCDHLKMNRRMSDIVTNLKTKQGTRDDVAQNFTIDDAIKGTYTPKQMRAIVASDSMCRKVVDFLPKVMADVKFDVGVAGVAEGLFAIWAGLVGSAWEAGRGCAGTEGLCKTDSGLAGALPDACAGSAVDPVFSWE